MFRNRRFRAWTMITTIELVFTPQGLLEMFSSHLSLMTGESREDAGQ
jgi:hypothetical protein